MANHNALLSCLGLCARARKLIFGVPMIIDALRGGKNVPILVMEAVDTSENTHKRITDKCTHYGVEHVRLDVDGGTLAYAVGKSGSLAAVALCDKSMKEMLSKHLSAQSTNEN